MHKDFAKGLEASRKQVFPSARPCADYAHMRRASYKKLRQLMHVETRQMRKARSKARGVGTARANRADESAGSNNSNLRCNLADNFSVATKAIQQGSRLTGKDRFCKIHSGAPIEAHRLQGNFVGSQSIACGLQASG